MNHFYLLISLAGCFVITGLSMTAEAQNTLVLTPSQDAPIAYHDNYNSANANYNYAPHCSAISQPGATGGVNKTRGLMEFDLSSIPDTATIFGAFLNLSASGPLSDIGQVTQVGHMGQNASHLQRITSLWNANTVTWNNQPTTTNVDAVPLAQSTYSQENYLSIDVTALVQTMVLDPSNSFGFELKLDNETPSRGILIFGGNAPELDKRPSLVVVYGNCEKVTNIGELDGTNGHLTVSPNITYPGGSVRMDLPNGALGASNLVLINAIGQVIYTHPVYQWPMSLTVPALAQGTYTWKVQDAAAKVVGVARMVIQ